jgi:hypothetical protein
VSAIIEEIGETYGFDTDIDQIPTSDYWDIVRRHDRMALPADLVAEMGRMGYQELTLLPAVTELHEAPGAVVFTTTSGLSSLSVIDAQRDDAGEWKWMGYGPGIAFKEGRLGRLADLAARRATQGIATRTEVRALGEISSVWIHAYLRGPHGETLPAAEVDARILNEMDSLKARLALLSDTRARYIERVMDEQADVSRRGVQTRAAAALAMSPATLSRLLSEAEKRHARWTANAATAPQ